MSEAFEKQFKVLRGKTPKFMRDTIECRNVLQMFFAAGQAAGRLEGYHTVARVEFYIHKWGKEGRLPVIDYIPAELIGEEVEVIIRKRGEGV